MQVNSETAKANMIAVISQNIAELEAALAKNDPAAIVMCWPAHNLAAMFGKPGIASAVRVDMGTIYRAGDYAPNAVNGRGEKAVAVNRGKALAAALAESRQLLAVLTA